MNMNMNERKQLENELVRMHFSDDALLESVRLRICRTDWYGKLLEENNAITCPVGNTDLVYYVVCCIQTDDMMASFIVDSEWPSAQLATKERVLEAAMARLYEEEVNAMKIEDVLEELTRQLIEEGLAVEMLDRMPKLFNGDMLKTLSGAMIVVSNKDTFHGAPVAFTPEAMEYIRKSSGRDTLTIIPSSVHELIYLTDDDLSKDLLYLTLSIMQVNSNEECISPEQVLSDHPYIWDGKELRNGVSE